MKLSGLLSAFFAGLEAFFWGFGALLYTAVPWSDRHLSASLPHGVLETGQPRQAWNKKKKSDTTNPCHFDVFRPRTLQESLALWWLEKAKPQCICVLQVAGHFAITYLVFIIY